ncbi:GNAT family N-acetyltransferase [Bellilinea sp.]|uniref:GNAT family N-acetyltransferase n=1 Tax=Bellilinea sp. TaxID=2838785 RepID=UPI002ADDAED0|nr:GNAT family N-acetyltransferase [Bellilinea sp.]
MDSENAGKAWMTWRGLQAEDEPKLRELDRACKQADGDEWVSNLVGDALAAMQEHVDNTFCAAGEEILMAVGWIQLLPSSENEQQVILGGRVHPLYRRRGLGTLLLEWLENRANLVSGYHRIRRLIIRNEALTADAHSIYVQSGFTPIFAENMMVCSLEHSPPADRLPETYRLVNWTAETAPLFYRAYCDAFYDRAASFDPLEKWIAEYEGDTDFLPHSSWLAISEDNRPVAFVTAGQMGKMAWISQTGVVPQLRGQGVAFGLLAHALRHFQQVGYPEVGLHVNVNNPAAIRRFYELGFRRRLTRARYEKTAL